MTILARLNERLKGARLLLLALILSIPDILDGLVGFDWDSVLPPEYAGYGAKVGACIALTRLIVIPAIKAVRRSTKKDGKGDEEQDG